MSFQLAETNKTGPAFERFQVSYTNKIQNLKYPKNVALK